VTTRKGKVRQSAPEIIIVIANVTVLTRSEAGEHEGSREINETIDQTLHQAFADPDAAGVLAGLFFRAGGNIRRGAEKGVGPARP